ncbi:MAG TPA: lactate utilization protein [Puia sp.]|nr:lactate utilization protein [Puia sp.]
MKVSQAKENTLKKIRKALIHTTPIPFPQSEGNNSVFQASRKELEIEFAENFTGLLGKFIFCVNLQELAAYFTELVEHASLTRLYSREKVLIELLKKNNFVQPFIHNLADCDAAVTSCELLVARTGSIVMSAAQESGRTVSVYAPIHICIAFTSQLVYDIREGLQLLKERYHENFPSLITFATGPSRTADIEKSLVVGVHGPKEVYLFLVDQQ